MLAVPVLGGWHVLVRVEEGDCRGFGGGPFSVCPLNLQVVAGGCELGWYPDVPDVALQAWRPDQVGDPSDALPAGQGWPRLGDLEEGGVTGGSMPTSLRVTPCSRMRSSAALPT